MAEQGFAAWLRAARRAADLTQAELAVRSGVAVRTIRDLEAGRVSRPRSDTERALREALSLGDRAAEPASRPVAGQETGPCVRVLGRVELRDGTQRVDVAGEERRALLGYLAVRAGHAVSADELLDLVWDGRSGVSRSALQTHVSRLRKLLQRVRGGTGTPRIDHAGGYRMVVADHEVDLLAVRAAAKRARAASSAVEAFALLAPAVALIEGPVLADVPRLSGDASVVAADEELRKVVVYFAELCLAVGDAAAAIGPLRATLAVRPLDEGVCARLMTVLSRTGRQAEALDHFRALRERLVDELGVDPGAELTTAFERVLRGGDGGDGTDGTDAGMDEEPAAALPPAQVPAAVEDFTGRDVLAGRVGELLVTAVGTGPRVVAISGVGGAGKTTLATHVAHAVRGRFPDGQLFADLHGFGDRPADPAEVLRGFLTALGATAIPAGLDERAAQFRSLLQDRRMLVVLDNARDAEQVTPLVPGTPGNAVLVTSRNTTVGPPGSRHVPLAPLDRADSVTLLARIVGADRVAADPVAAEDVAAACGDLPLAIRVAGARLAARPRWTVRHMAERMADRRRRLDELSQALSVRASFQLSYDMLDDEHAAAFRRLGSWPTPEVAATTVAAILDVPVAVAERVLDDLTDVSLVEATTPGRYRLHDLLHDYAGDVYRQHEPPEVRAGIENRVLRFAAATARNAHLVLFPGQSPYRSDRVAESPHELTFDDADRASQWFEADSPALSALVQQATEDDVLDAQCAALLAVMLAAQVFRAGDLARAELLTRQGLLVCGRTTNRELATRLLAQHGRLLGGLGRFDEAERSLEQALEEYRLQGAENRVTEVIARLGFLLLQSGRYQDAEARCAAAVRRSVRDGNVDGHIPALVGLAQALTYQGRGQSAERHARELIRLCAVHDPSNEGVGWSVLAKALMEQGRCAEAIDAVQQALALGRAAGDVDNEPARLTTLATAYRLTDQLDAALDTCVLALAKRRDRSADFVTAEILIEFGHALLALGRRDEAAVRWNAALGHYERIGHPQTPQLRDLLASLGSERP